MNIKKSKTLVTTILFIAMLSLTSVVSATLINPGELHIEGSSTVLPVTTTAGPLFHDDHPSLTVFPDGGGSGAGFDRLAAGTIDIGAHSKEPGDDWGTTGLEDMNIWAIGIDSLAIIVHTDKSANIEDVTIEIVRDIFTGVYNNWQELNALPGISGMPDADIGRYIRPTDSGTHACFKDNFLKPFGLSNDDLASDCETKTDNIDVYNAMTVPAGSNYIAYIGRGFLDLGGVHDLWIWNSDLGEYVEPSKANSESGDYPISRWLWYSTNGAIDQEEALYLSWVMAHPDLVVDEGYMNKWRCDYTGRDSGDTTAPIHNDLPDAVVNGADLGYWLQAYIKYWGAGQFNPYADIDADTDVDGNDLGKFLSNYIKFWSGQSPPGYP